MEATLDSRIVTSQGLRKPRREDAHRHGVSRRGDGLGRAFVRGEFLPRDRLKARGLEGPLDRVLRPEVARQRDPGLGKLSTTRRHLATYSALEKSRYCFAK